MRILFLLGWVSALATANGCGGPLSSSPRQPPSSTPGPDDRFAGDEPCPAAGAGVVLEESAAFVAGDLPRALVVVMGGSTEVDDAGARFAAAARGGDVLVLRTTGSTSSYTSWFGSELAVDPAPRAVATVRTDDVDAGADDAVLCRVARADAIWLAGGDQSDYLLCWPAALHQSLARAVARGVALGGTSAGAMSLSSLAFDAREGSLGSEEALLDPSQNALSLMPSPFAAPALAATLVDTHFTERDRLGRLIAFAARAGSSSVLGIGIDEETSLTLDDGVMLVEGAGDAWAVRVSTTTVTPGTALSTSAVVVPLSQQTAWPPKDSREAPGARVVVVDEGRLVD